MKTLFICGTGRCGTTLLADIIAQEFSVLNMGETHIFHQWEKFIEVFRRRIIKGLAKNNYEDMVRKLDKNSIASNLLEALQPFFAKLCFEISENSGKNLILDKTPHNLEISRRLDYLYVNAHFIHVFRNPLDVFASLKEREWGYTNVNDFVEWYSQFMHNSLNQWEHLPDGRKMVVELEQLIESPATIRPICNWLRIPVVNHDMIDKNFGHVGRHKYDLSRKEIGRIKDTCFKFYKKWKGYL